MNPPGDADLGLRTRRARLDALEALEDQLDALIVIGAQAVYLHTREIEIAISEETKDADLGVDARALKDDPRLEVVSASVAALAGDLLSVVEARH